MRNFFLLLALFATVAICPNLRGQNSAPANPGLAGKWHFVFDTEGGPRDFDADFTVSGTRVGGTFGKSEVKGDLVGQRFELTFPTESDEVGPGTLKLIGKIAANQLTGSWAFQSYDGTFKATRPKAEKPAAK